jgi:RNA polymerase sigma-70 factor (ECF subfamily)
MTTDASFDAIVSGHRDRVYRVVLSVLGPLLEAEAEDVTQEVFMRLLRVVDSFRGESTLGTWLYRVAFNAAIDRRRLARLRMPHVEVSVIPERGATGLDAETRRSVMRAVERLPDTYRSVVHLHYWMGESVEEISESLSMPAGTVKSHLHRARNLLREMLGEEKS